MFLKSLKLVNFRSYRNLGFEFSAPITILVGKNAQGKSNFLEGIYYLATAKSVRAGREEELIKQGSDFLRVAGQVEAGDTKTELEVAMQNLAGRLKKRVKLNGIARKVSEYAGNLAAVLFSPEDINLVSGAPSLRRYFIDQILSQIDRDYRKALSSYENLLTRKNRVLKRVREGIGRRDELDYWSDAQLVLGAAIVRKREEFFAFINSSGQKLGNFEYEYLESQISLERLRQYREREVEAAASLIGPHRDDFLFKLNGQNLAKFGSRGEMRTAVLDLKLAEVSFIENSLGFRPVLLLDDIFSELDLEHRRHVVALSALQQTVISTVELDEALKRDFNKASLYFVENGQISSIAGK